VSRPVIELSNFSVFYREKGSGLLNRGSRHEVVRNLTFELREGEILGLVGESGCGKSTLARAILGLEPDYVGRVIHHTDRPQMVFQDPYGSLNPRMTVGRIVEEPLIISSGYDRLERRRRTEGMLQLVGLDERYLSRYPRELSGGQRQRVSIAAALIGKPQVLVADEPVSSLDATIQTQILDLLWALHRGLNLSILFISHDLAVVEHLCDRVLIMYEGEIIESGTSEAIFKNPQHTYTRQLIQASRGMTI